MSSVTGQQLPEPAAPDWLIRLVRTTRAPVPWPAVARAGIAIGAPLAVGTATGNLDHALFVSMGALAGAISDRRGPYRVRAQQITGAGIAGAAGFVLGEAVFGHNLLTLAVLLLVAYVSSVLGATGTLASTATMQLAVFTVVASGRDFPGPWWGPPLLYLTGAAWELGLTMLGMLRDRSSPERRAVARGVDALAALAEAVGTAEAITRRRELTDALTAAYDGLLAGRVRSGGRSPAFRRFMGLLNALSPVIETVVAAMHAGRPLPPEVPGTLRDLARALRERRPPPPIPADQPALRPLRAVTADAAEPGADPARPPHPSPWSRLRSHLQETVQGSSVHIFALRVTLCVGAAEVVRQLAPNARSYWIALTVVIVLKPDFGSVFVRAVQRGAGTVVGAVIGAAILAAVPHGFGLVVCITVLAAMLPAAMAWQYGLFSAFITPMIVLLIDLLDPEGWSLLVARLVDTCIGCGIVLVLGYLLWPESFRSRIGPRFLDTVGAISAYTRAGLRPASRERPGLRRAAYRSLSDLRTAFQQALAEPGAIGRAAAAWWPVIVSLERITDAVTRAARGIDAGRPAPEPGLVDGLAGAIAALSPGTDEASAPALPEPQEPSLAEIGAEIEAARQVLSGQRPGTTVGGPS